MIIHGLHAAGKWRWKRIQRGWCGGWAGVGKEMIRERHSGCLHPAKSTKKTNKTKENKIKSKHKLNKNNNNSK